MGIDGQGRPEIQPLFMTHFAPSEKGDGSSTVMRPMRGNILPVTGISAKTPFLDALAVMEARKDTTSAKVQLDGRTVVKFSAKEGSSTYTVWVDPQTKLPVRIENAFPDSSRGGHQPAGLHELRVGPPGGRHRGVLRADPSRVPQSMTMARNGHDAIKELIRVWSWA